MHDTPSPFTAPAQQQQQQQQQRLPSLYRYFYYNELPEMNAPDTYDEARKMTEVMSAEVAATGPTVGMAVEDATGADDCSCCCATGDYYVPRAVMYSFLFVCSSVVLALSILNVSSPEMAHVDLSYRVYSTLPRVTPEYSRRRVVQLTLFSPAANYKYVMSNFTEAMNSARYPADTAVRPNQPTRASGILTLFVLIFSAVLVVLSALNLGCLIAHCKRQHRQQEESAAAARVRQAVGITCLVLVFVCLALSGGAVGTAQRGVWDLYDAGDDAMFDYKNTTAADRDVVLSNRTVWTHVPNLILLFIMGIMLCVPILSGIADRPVTARPRL